MNSVSKSKFKKQKIAIIIGAGPAGLTAAYELLDKTDIKPVVFEATEDIGGISKTINYKGNRIDIGGHRFFSKSDRVMKWWQNILPLQGRPSRDDLILQRNVPLSNEINAPDPEYSDKVMLVRRRLSRILFRRMFFDYPISLTYNTIEHLGLFSVSKILMSYMTTHLLPIKKEKSLEDFFINRFGKELYQTFFKDYTEKVWGIPCNKIKPEWGAQRIKSLSLTKAIYHGLRNMISKDQSISQKNTDTSLIEQFTYPKFGPGQMWEEVSRIVKTKGGDIYLNHEVIGLKRNNRKVTDVVVKNNYTGEIKIIKGDLFFSTMPVKDLIRSLDYQAPTEVRNIADGLMYRDFMTVGLLLKKLKIQNTTKIRTVNDIVPDNWIYIQERDVKIGRLQIFNNWSPYMVNNKDTVWLGLEYFCNVGDELWNKDDEEFAQFAIGELSRIGIIDIDDVLDKVVIRMTKTYPAYFGTYDQFDIIRQFTDKIENLYLIGRNGMHRYNNSDHSMLTAMVAVENILNGVTIKDNIWAVNAESDYHEAKSN